MPIVRTRGRRRSRKKLTYHGRSGYPVVHTTRTGRQFVMVRKPGGGTKRLYEGSRYRVNGNRTRRLTL